MIYYKDAKVQLLDLPGIIEGAAQGKGRGKQVIGVARTSDMIMMVLDAEHGLEQKIKLTRELESVGIRLNSYPPNISISRHTGGGVALNSTIKLTKVWGCGFMGKRDFCLIFWDVFF